MKQISKFDFLVNSPEFRAFSRPTALGIEKQLEKMSAKVTAEFLQTRMHESLNIDPLEINANLMSEYKKEILGFRKFFKKILPILEEMRTDVARAMHTKGEVVEGYRKLFFVIVEYEELNLQQYASDNESMLVVTNQANKELRTQFDEATKKQKNPFVEVYHWVQGEIFDLQALSQAIEKLSEIEKEVSSNKKKQ